jgi:hypothetical protein
MGREKDFGIDPFDKAVCPRFSVQQNFPPVFKLADFFTNSFRLS